MTTADNSLRRRRYDTLNRLLWNTALIPSHVRDCGTGFGLKAYRINMLTQEKKTPTAFHIFFKLSNGLLKYKDSSLTNIHYDVDQSRKQLAWSEEQFQQNLTALSFLNYFKRQIPAQFSEVKDQQLSFVHLEVDLYEPIADALEFFFPLAANGIMALDDHRYTGSPATAKDVDGCVAKATHPYLLPLPSVWTCVAKKKQRIYT